MVAITFGVILNHLLPRLSTEKSLLKGKVDTICRSRPVAVQTPFAIGSPSNT